MTQSKVSVIINNYNYGQYLAQCIQSVLDQSAPADEVIVVDDGSTDDSRPIIERYKGRIKVVLKRNGGQASALNAGFAESVGDWIWFVDADDWLMPAALTAIRNSIGPETTRIIFPLVVAQGDVPQRKTVPNSIDKMQNAFVPLDSLKQNTFFPPPTTGNVFHRSLLDRIMPIPDGPYAIAADLYLSLINIRIQRITSIDEPLGYYRQHGTNNYYWKSQFFTDPGLAHRRATTILNYLDLYQSEIAYESSNEDGVQNRLLPLNLVQLKDLLVSERILGSRRPHSEVPRKEIWKRSVDRVREQYAGRALARELCILLLMRHAPLALFPLFSHIEAVKKSILNRRKRHLS